MYPNFKAEMARRGITQSQIAKALGLSVSSVSQKLSKPYRLRMSEASCIRDRFFPGMPLDYLFSSNIREDAS